MKITSLNLTNFRNYEQEEISFSNGINILVGANAQGKTNAAEAIFFLCTGYSPRANRDKLVIRSGQEFADIKGTAEGIYGQVSVRILFNKNDKKNICSYSKKPRNATRFAAFFSFALFSVLADRYDTDADHTHKDQA